MAKVSIIVPIYRVERYLRECVDSILAQTLRDIEVILIDDGSPDKCGEIVDEYAKKDKRVVAIHQENKGYSATVNRGIKLAKGEYIGVIESDDFIEEEMYEKLYKSAKKYKTDVVKGGFFRYNSVTRTDDYYFAPNGVDLRRAPSGAFKIENFPELLAFHASIWSSIYRADFIKKIKLAEGEGASYQDFPFMVEVMTKAKMISVVPDGLVHWRNEPGQGNSTGQKGEKLLLMLDNTKTGLSILKKSGKYEGLKDAFYAHALWVNSGFFYKIDKEYREKYYKGLKEIFGKYAKEIRKESEILKNIPEEYKYDGFESFESTRFLRFEDKLFLNVIADDAGVDSLRRAYVLGGLKRKVEKYWDIVPYAMFGLGTTIVNVLAYAVCSDSLQMPTVLATSVAWALSIAFAYITNRKWVFNSTARGLVPVFREATSFVACRLATGLLDVAMMYIFVDLMHCNGLIIKIISNIIVIALNYIASKLFIFRRREE